MTNLTKKHGHISLLVANLIFGLNNPMMRTIMPEKLSPYTVTFFRMFGGALLFWLASIFVKKENMPKRDILKLFFASLFGIVINQLFFFEGLSLTSPIDASLVITLLPIITMLFAAIFIGEPITWLKVIGVIVGASGALLLILSSSTSENNGNFKGNLIVLVSVFSFAVYLTMFKGLISKYSPIHTMKWMFLFATIVSLPISYTPFISTNFTALNNTDILKIFYVIFFTTFIGYMLIPIGQKTLRPTTLSMYNYVQPIIASFVTVAIGMDNFSYINILSAVLVFAGVYVVTQSKSKAQLDAERAKNNL